MFIAYLSLWKLTVFSFRLDLRGTLSGEFLSQINLKLYIILNLVTAWFVAAFWHEYREWYFKIAITISWANRRGRFVAIRKLLELYLCRIAHANHAITPGFHVIARNSTLSCRRSYAIRNDRGDCKETARSWGAPNRAIIRRQGFVWFYDYLVNWEKRTCRNLKIKLKYHRSQPVRLQKFPRYDYYQRYFYYYYFFAWLFPSGSCSVTYIL